jgi:SAM-dependent methyltransferase
LYHEYDLIVIVNRCDDRLPLSRAIGVSGRLYEVELSTKLMSHLTTRHNGYVTSGELKTCAPIEFKTNTDRTVGFGGIPSVDVIFNCDVYHHFEHYTDIIADIHRTLRDNGHLVCLCSSVILRAPPPFYLSNSLFDGCCCCCCQSRFSLIMSVILN